MTMKISQTVIATGPNGEDLNQRVQPVEMVWSLDADELTVMESVAQMLQHARDRRWTKTLAITIEL